MSRTHTGCWFVAMRFRIRMRVGSARALNHFAYSLDRATWHFGDFTKEQRSTGEFILRLLRAIEFQLPFTPAKIASCLSKQANVSEALESRDEKRESHKITTTFR